MSEERAHEFKDSIHSDSICYVCGRYRDHEIHHGQPAREATPPAPQAAPTASESVLCPGEDQRDCAPRPEPSREDIAQKIADTLATAGFGWAPLMKPLIHADLALYALAAAPPDAASARLQAALKTECTCRAIEKCDRCEAIDAALRTAQEEK